MDKCAECIIRFILVRDIDSDAFQVGLSWHTGKEDAPALYRKLHLKPELIKEQLLKCVCILYLRIHIMCIGLQRKGHPWVYVLDSEFCSRLAMVTWCRSCLYCHRVSLEIDTIHWLTLLCVGMVEFLFPCVVTLHITFSPRCHEWCKHGTCTTMSQHTFFQSVLDYYSNGMQFGELLQQQGVVPSQSKRYSVRETSVYSYM